MQFSHYFIDELVKTRAVCNNTVYIPIFSCNFFVFRLNATEHAECALSSHPLRRRPTTLLGGAVIDYILIKLALAIIQNLMPPSDLSKFLCCDGIFKPSVSQYLFSIFNMIFTLFPIFMFNIYNSIFFMHFNVFYFKCFVDEGNGLFYLCPD